MHASLVCVVFCSVFVVAACDDDATAHANDAIDVAGAYRDDVADVDLVIANEDGKNDVVLTFTRAAVPDVEAAFVARAVAVAGDFDARVVVVGAGSDAFLDEVNGGENVSVDGGASTVVDCDGDDVDAGDGGVLRWSAHLEGDAARLDGALRLSLRERRSRPGDVDGASTESDIVATALSLRRVP